MTDIIKDAKRLLDGATPGPWELINGEIHQIQHTPEQCTSIRCDHRWPVLSESWGESAAVVAEGEDLALMAAVPEMAQALAEETYEYAVQAKTGSRWEYKQDGFFRDAWFSELRKAKAGARELRSIGKETRIVRRRVSPPEVIDE